MTRETKLWQPARLLCKRFGVKDPNPEPEVPSETPGASISTSASQGADLGADAGGAVAGVIPSTGVDTGPSHGKRDLANIGLGENDGQGEDILTYERPSMDIFKAIFASDDEGSEDDNDNAQEDETADVPIPPAQPSDTALTQTNPAKANASPAEVDVSTFRPTFIPRDSQSKSANGKGLAAKEKKSKKPKGGALVSFDLDEGGVDLSISARRENKERDRPKKKRKKQKGDGNEDVWVEKPVPDTVKNLPVDTPHEALKMDASEVVAGPPRGRKRAIDFM